MPPPGTLSAMDSEERHRRMCGGKTRYKDEAAAELAIVRSEWARDGEGSPLRTYRCDYCGRWHLTSQPPR